MTQTPATQAEPKRWSALTILLLGNFMNLLDVSIVNVALPSIQETTGAGFAALQWVIAGYLLVLALGLLPGGRLGDRFGHKRMFLAGVGAFTLTSALCGLAPDSGTLVVARLLQGGGAALMVPQVLAIIHTSFAENERAAAFGLSGAVAGLAVIIGPVLGGGLIAFDLFGLGWRWIFLVNVPVGLFVLVRGLSVLPAREGNGHLALDGRGMALAAPIVVLLICPTIEGSEAGWSPALIAAMAAALPVLALFVWLQHRQDARGEPTLMPPRLFRRRSYAAGVVLAFAFFSGVAGFFMVFAVYLQQGLGHSALEAGLALLPFAVGAFVASAASAMRKGRANRWLLAAGSTVMAVGMVSLLLLLDGAEDALAWPVLSSLALAGAGMGLFVVNMFDFAMSEVPDADAGAASGLLHTAQQLGNAAGIAVLGAIFFGTLAIHGAGAWESAITRALWYEIALYLACTVIAVAASAGRIRDSRIESTR